MLSSKGPLRGCWNRVKGEHVLYFIVRLLVTRNHEMSFVLFWINARASGDRGMKEHSKGAGCETVPGENSTLGTM